MIVRHILSFCLPLIGAASLLLGLISYPAAEISPPPTQILAEGGDNFEQPMSQISSDEEQALWNAIQSDLLRLRAQGIISAPNASQPVLFDWPVRLAPGLTDYAGYSVSAFPDHDPASGPWLDYNGGTRTYDTHRGTDIALWPFSWNKLDSGDVQVVAAAAGTILEMQNNTPSDHNCGSASGSLGNYLVLTHADGRITIYGHMKYNSLTSKGVGQTVAAGEYLGSVGSSGNSSGPHLHFEVRSAIGSSELWVDPFTGPRNPVASSWKNQHPYLDSAINKIATATAFPVSTNCLPTVTNIKDSFFAPAHVAFQVYYRDYQGSLPTLLSIFDPNGSVFQTWSYTDVSTTFNRAAGRYWSIDFPASVVPGTWRFEAQYNGQTYQTLFTIKAPSTPTNFIFVPLILH